MHIANFALSYGMLTVLFAAIYKLLPDTPLAWHDVIFGSAVTALLFVGGRGIIGYYLGNAHLNSLYGAMAAPIAVALWIYYSAQVFFLGAEMTKIFAHRHGSRLGLPARPQAGMALSYPACRRLLPLIGLIMILAASAILRSGRKRCLQISQRNPADTRHSLRR